MKNNVIRPNFAKNNKGSAYLNKCDPFQKLLAKNRFGTVASRIIEPLDRAIYRAARVEMDELLVDIIAGYDLMAGVMTARQIAQLEGVPNYFDKARKALKISKNYKVHRYAYQLLADEFLFDGCQESLANAKNRLQKGV